MNFETIIKSRYSVRKFLKKPIEKETLKKILETGRLAPTAKNLQPQKIYVLESSEALEKLNTVCKSFDAPVVLMVCCDLNQVWKSPLEEGYHTAEMDCSIVSTYMMLEATQLGIGSCWVRYFNKDLLKQTFELPENIDPVSLLLIGYPSVDSKPSVLHGQRKELNETVQFL